MKISIITPSFNKTQYVLEAIGSVMNQTYRNFEYWVAENSTDPETEKAIVENFTNQDPVITLYHRTFTEDERKKQYATTVILNELLPKMTGDLIFYLSDDDYLLPNCFERVLQEFHTHPEAQVVYFGLKVMDGTKNSWNQVSIMKADSKLPMGTNMDCMLDGGQVVFRRECLAKLQQPYFRTEMDNETAHCDGIFLNTLSKHFDFYNIPDILAVKRRTNISTFIKS